MNTQSKQTKFARKLKWSTRHVYKNDDHYSLKTWNLGMNFIWIYRQLFQLVFQSNWSRICPCFLEKIIYDENFQRVCKYTNFYSQGIRDREAMFFVNFFYVQIY